MLNQQLSSLWNWQTVTATVAETEAKTDVGLIQRQVNTVVLTAASAAAAIV